LVTRPMSNLAILANSKTQKAFLFPVHAIFLHDCPLAVRSASTPLRLVHTKKNLGEILYLLICSFLLCLSVLVVAQPILEVPEGLMNYSVHRVDICSCTLGCVFRKLVVFFFPFVCH
jgi:hypothetical protein